jgi:hypothetical protein
MADGAQINVQDRTIVVGTHVVGGRAKGNYLNVVMADRSSIDMGVDGEGTHKTTDDKSATITVSVMPSSVSNDVLSALELSGLPVPIAIRDGAGRTIQTAARAKVVKHADVTWSDGAEVRVWTLVTTRLNSFVGGMAPSELGSTPEV